MQFVSLLKKESSCNNIIASCEGGSGFSIKIELHLQVKRAICLFKAVTQKPPDGLSKSYYTARALSTCRAFEFQASSCVTRG